MQDFDRLPTRFRALATDLETGEAVVMGQGDLVTVLRASMSAPGVLTPVEMNGRLLVDGGLVDNLPVELAQSMGVDRLIVVDVSFPLAQAGRTAVRRSTSRTRWSASWSGAARSNPSSTCSRATC